ncbi:hypothetical protein [Bacillus amyloliquefaciens]|uniref:Uncharacterized protein n=1 Tax=Bacillus amyloliquefaciens TaxID=1390 RepID=A0AAP3YFR7_BACAM|nr:hypothetical protein [Bacillus amyloliquefaciens]MDF4194945.1 hypothetical protein [Bacillus amyloliquefaciens]MDF4213029.1 hypothetical protein [Bacillus amyloliquefaciens]
MGCFYQAAHKPFYKQIPQAVFITEEISALDNAVRKTLCLNKRGENQ